MLTSSGFRVIRGSQLMKAHISKQERRPRCKDLGGAESREFARNPFGCRWGLDRASGGSQLKIL